MNFSVYIEILLMFLKIKLCLLEFSLEFFLVFFSFRKQIWSPLLHATSFCELRETNVRNEPQPFMELYFDYSKGNTVG